MRRRECNLRTRHLLALATAVLAVVLTPTAARADTRFHADSGDACRYGTADGVLSTRLTLVAVKGTLTDRPTLAEPTICRDDGYYSIATFTAYFGERVVDQQAVRINNGTALLELTLGQNSTIARIDRVVVQICRNPIATLPPGYCGRPAEYRAPF
jgi:hypothetical protein